MSDDLWCVGCGDNVATVNVGTDEQLCARCAYDVGSPSQKDLNAALGAAVRCVAEKYAVHKDGHFHSWMTFGAKLVADAVALHIEKEVRDAAVVQKET